MITVQQVPSVKAISYPSHICSPIVVVAPYSPIGSRKNPPLGGAHKIASVIRILARFGRRIVFVNSAHNPTFLRGSTVYKAKIGGVIVTTIAPFTLPNRPIGKLLNLFAAPILGRRLANLAPSMLWIYNGYSFESILALALKKLTGVPLVLQVEDLHSARRREKLNLKPRLDMWFFKKVLPMANLVTCVNECIQHRVTKRGLKAFLLPSILSHHMFEQERVKTPFSTVSFTLGYFGGLNEEKGADILLEVSHKLPDRWNLTITGSGALSPSFQKIADRCPERMTFRHETTDDEMYRLMMQCDVIVNPHKPITQMGNGIFPFKVFEALASERLLISTPLPSCGISLMDSVLFFDGSSGDLVDKLTEAPRFYAKAFSKIFNTASEVRRFYSEDAVFKQLQRALPLKKFIMPRV